jgi:hypothetical protein
MTPELTTEDDQMRAFAAGLLQGEEASLFIAQLHADPELAKDFILYYHQWQGHQPVPDLRRSKDAPGWQQKIRKVTGSCLKACGWKKLF